MPGIASQIRAITQRAALDFSGQRPLKLEVPSRNKGFQFFRYLPVLRSEFFIFIAGSLIGGQSCNQLAFRCATLQQFNFSVDVKHGCSNALTAAVSEAAREMSISNKKREA
jgi:hypothetical protein